MSNLTTSGWQSLSSFEKKQLFLRLCFLKATLEHTHLLRSTVKLEAVVCRALAARELELVQRIDIPEALFRAATRSVLRQPAHWVKFVRTIIRNHQIGAPLPQDFDCGSAPSWVQHELVQYVGRLFDGLCANRAYLLGYSRKQLIEFASEQARISRKPGDIEFSEAKVHTAALVAYQHRRVLQLNDMLMGRFDNHLANSGRVGFLNVAALFKRCCDSNYIYKSLRKITARSRESLYLRLGMVSHCGEKYSSSHTTRERIKQHERTASWMGNTVLMEQGPNGLPSAKAIAGIDSPNVPGKLTLSDCAKSPTHRFSKLYTFVHAIDTIAQQAGLHAALLTITMPPEFHPKPMHGAGNWSGVLPIDTNRELASAWRRVLQRLDRVKIGITGLRVVEPHQDGCPHWHVWLNYQPLFENQILLALMSEFSGQLKLRMSSSTRVYDNRADFVAGRCVSNPDTRASTRLDFAVIDRSISSGATYLMKYLLKTMNLQALNKAELNPEQLDLLSDLSKHEPIPKVQACDESSLNNIDGANHADDVNGSLSPHSGGAHDAEIHQAYALERSDLCPEMPPSSPPAGTNAGAGAGKGACAHLFENSQRIDAYRSVWGFRAFDFFGLARCLGVWDELRKITKRPDNKHLASLWALARGTELEGRIPAGSKIQGKAAEFILALGSMRAVSFEPKGSYFKVGLLKAPKRNQFGEEIMEVVGLKLFEVRKSHVLAKIQDKTTGEIKTRRRLKWVKEELTSLITKTKRWLLQSTRESRVKSRHQSLATKAANFILAAHALKKDDILPTLVSWLLGGVDSTTHIELTEKSQKLLLFDATLDS